MAYLQPPKVPTLRRFQTGSIGSQFQATSRSVSRARAAQAPDRPRVPRPTKPKVPVAENPSLQTGEVPETPTQRTIQASSMFLGPTAWMALHKTIQGLEQLHGGQAWFNVGGGTGGFSYGSNIAQALVRANSYADINVTFLNQQQQAAARAGAVLDELGRGEAGVTGAYNYVRAPTEKFTPLTNLAPGLVAPTLIGALIPWGSLQGAFSTWLSETTGYNFGVGPSVEV